MKIIIFIPKYHGQLFSIGLRDESRNHLGWFVKQIKNEQFKSYSNYFHVGISSLLYKDFIYHYAIDEYKEAEEYILNLAIRLADQLCCDVNLINLEND